MGNLNAAEFEKAYIVSSKFPQTLPFRKISRFMGRGQRFPCGPALNPKRDIHSIA
jgi:hypothetical protein